jgi:cytochrome c peroxidase
MEFYDVGGGQGMGLEVPYQTLPPDSLGLEEGEKRAIIAFMKTLTDKDYKTSEELLAKR